MNASGGTYQLPSVIAPAQSASNIAFGSSGVASLVHSTPVALNLHRPSLYLVLPDSGRAGLLSQQISAEECANMPM
jgi:hypothetical protein